MEMPINSAISNGFACKPGFGAQPRFVAFSGGSSSKSSQATTNKDNSAIVEDQGMNVTDGSRGAQDEALIIQGGGKKSSTSVNASRDERVFEDEAQILSGSSRNVSENLFGAGGNLSLSNSQVHLETLSDQVVSDAFDFGTYAISESLKVGSAGLDDAYENAKLSQQAANQLSRVTNEVIAGIAREKTEDSDSQIFKDLQKNLLIGGVILVGAIYLSRQK